MEIIEATTIKLTRSEFLALQKGLNELELLQKKYPDERNGYDLNSQRLVNGMRHKINAILG